MTHVFPWLSCGEAHFVISAAPTPHVFPWKMALKIGDPINHHRLVVYLPLWKIWVRQLGLLFHIIPNRWKNRSHVPVSTNQIIFSPRCSGWTTHAIRPPVQNFATSHGHHQGCRGRLPSAPRGHLRCEIRSSRSNPGEIHTMWPPPVMLVGLDSPQEL